MSESALGGNATQALESYGRRLSDALDALADAQEAVKDIKAEAKSDGFDAALLSRVLRELRLGPEYIADQLAKEAERDTYRRALGVPTDLDAAMTGVRTAVETLPTPRRRKGRDE